MLVYTLLFTLDGKDPKDNLYIEMFTIWISYLLRNGELDKNDRIVVLIDKKTYDYMNNLIIYKKDDVYVGGMGVINEMVNKPDTPELSFFIIDDCPKNISEGLCIRYQAYDALENEIILFLDLDCLCVKSLSNLKNSVKGDSYEIYVMPEGELSHESYSGIRNAPLDTRDGFTAGCYAYKPCENVKRMFMEITEQTLNNQANPFYTIDQPFFNKYLYSNTINKKIMPKTTVLYNKINTESDSLFINLAGVPGDGSFHFKKMLYITCLLFSKSST